jgi:hypothetical protein
VFDPPGGVPHARHPWRDWTAPSFEVRSGHHMNAGIDGEAAVLTSPLEFTIRPQALRVRIARSHPGASPSAGVPETAWGTLRALARTALDGEPVQRDDRSR